jgi:hypothetical protein
MVQSNVGKIQPYSKYVSRLQRCIACVSKNTAVVDNGFTHRLWHNNLKYIAYEDSVYSFVEYRLLSIVEAYKAQIFFTCYIARLFPHTNNEAHEDLFSQTFSFCEIARPFPHTHDEASKEIFRRVIKPIMPDDEQRMFFLSCIARALAGETLDNCWYIGLFPHDCGKEIICKLLKYAFGSFVNDIQASNLLCICRSKNTTKAQRWMQDYEYTRIAFINKMSSTDNVSGKLDGGIMKMFCTNGYVSQLQMTMIFLGNDMPLVEPLDIYQNMQGFKFQSEPPPMGGDVHDSADIKDPLGNAISKEPLWGHGCLNTTNENSLEDFIKMPIVIDAFTRHIFESYTHEKPAQPNVVKDHTTSIQAAVKKSQQKRFTMTAPEDDVVELQQEQFAMIFQKGDYDDVIFYQDIRRAALGAGMNRLSNELINMYV